MNLSETAFITEKNNKDNYSKGASSSYDTCGIALLFSILLFFLNPLISFRISLFYFGLLGSCFGLRWFTPQCEVPLCGHATLASAAVLFNSLGEVRELFLHCKD